MADEETEVIEVTVDIAELRKMKVWLELTCCKQNYTHTHVH